jgi:multidrug efflux pump subunit AcrB
VATNPKPISVELIGDDFDQLTPYPEGETLPGFSFHSGVEELRSDSIVSKPEINIQIDRDRANRVGISTAQIGNEFRTAILGKKLLNLKTAKMKFQLMCA